jgi:hypothetical protein
MPDKSIKLAMSDMLARAPKLAQRLFEERMLIITPSDSMLHRLNEMGTCIWQLLEKPASTNDLCLGIEKAFDGFDRKKNVQEIVEFLQQLVSRGLLVRCMDENQ